MRPGSEAQYLSGLFCTYCSNLLAAHALVTVSKDPDKKKAQNKMRQQPKCKQCILGLGPSDLEGDLGVLGEQVAVELRHNLLDLRLGLADVLLDCLELFLLGLLQQKR